MINLLDSITLAQTKLKTKKLLLIVTIFVATVIFGLIIASMIILTGASRSADNYLKTALNGEYLVHVNPVVPDKINGYISPLDQLPEELKTHLKDLENKYIEQQKTLAKKYNIEFDSKSIEPILEPNILGEKDKFGKVWQAINRDSPVYGIYVKELQQDWLKTAKNTFDDLKKVASAEGATDFYRNSYGKVYYLNALYMPDGKDDLLKVVQPEIAPGDDYLATSVQNSSYVFTDQSLVDRYILPENEKRRENKATAIPVVITKQEAVQLFGERFGLSKEPSDAAGKVAWMKKLQDSVNGQTYQVCYRSSTEISIIQTAMQQNQLESTDSTASEPSITYSLPTSPCTPAVIKSDKRTESEKQATLNLEAYQKAAGTYQPRVTRLMTFQIVGIMSPNSSMYSGYNDLSSLINGLLSPQYQSGAFIPNQMYEKLADTHQHKDILQSKDELFSYGGGTLTEAGVTQAIVAFTKVDDAKKFIDKYTCLTFDTNSCNKLWSSQLYGQNYLLTEDINKKTQDIARLVLPASLLLAAMVMSFTMTRVIIDSRRETAVFRALGAKRIDIMRVYIVYSLMVACLTILFAFLIGITTAFIVDATYGSLLTNSAKVAYGVFDNLEPFKLIGFDFVLLAAVLGSIVAVSIVSVLPPIIRNVRRNPISDMREDG